MDARKRRMTVVLLLLCTALGAQNLHVDLDGMTVKQAMRRIRHESGLSFVYEAHDLAADKVVNIHASTLPEALDQLLEGQGLTYTVKDRSIILSKIPAPEAGEGDMPSVIRGRVVDEAGAPVAGAVVLVLGTGMGVLSMPDGTFELEARAGTLVQVSSLGLRAVEMPARPGMRVVLQGESQELDETVVVGYGSQLKVNLTGAVSSLSSKDLQRRAAPTLTHMLQGTVPGLFVQTYSGNPADSPSMMIRGYPSVNGGVPLVLVDGVEGDLAQVNAADVESISLIKDASSSAIYGAKASFGVILVTTKSGSASAGRPQVRYNGCIGFSTPTTRTDFETRGYDSVFISDLFMKETTGRGYTFYTEKDMDELYRRRGDRTEQPGRPWILQEERNGRLSWIYYCNTDWYHEMYTDYNPLQRHNVSVTGGNETVRYYLSAGYEHKEGTFRVRPERYDKYTVLGKTEFALSPRVSLSNRMGFYASTYDYPGNRNPDNTFAFGSFHGLASFPLQNPDGTWVYKTIFNDSNLTNGCHIELGEDTKRNNVDRYNFSDTAELRYSPLEGLDLRADMTYMLNASRECYRWTGMEYSLYPGEVVREESGRFMNRLEDYMDLDRYRDYNIWGTYACTLQERHHLRITGGFNAQRSYYKHHYTYADNIGSDLVSDYDLKQSDAEGNYLLDIRGGQGEHATVGFFGRVDYDWQGRYLLECSGRYDGSSAFQKGSRWGFFPSVSIGWRFSDEPFFRPFRATIPSGKVRFSVGTLGNQQVEPFQYMRTVSTHAISYLFESEKNLPVGAFISSPNAEDLTWETTRHYNFGFDLAFLQERLQLTCDLFIRDTIDMLTEGEDLPSAYGASSPLMNCADLRSKGYELSLVWTDSFNLAGHPLRYNITGAVSDCTTRITKFGNRAKVLGSHYVGETIGEIWGFVVDGLFESDEEAARYTDYAGGGIDQSYLAGGLSGGWKGGDLRFRDLDGDRIISKGGYTVDNPGDLKVIGNSMPRWQYGLTLQASWNGFDLSAFFQGIGRMNWYPGSDNMPFWGPYCHPYCTYYQKDFLDRCWSEDNTGAYFPRPRSGTALAGTTQLTEVNDRYLQNLGYCRLKNLTVGWSLPQSWVRKAGLGTARLYFTGENVAYVSGLDKTTRYIDPEACYVNSQNGWLYPWQRPFTFGVDITF